MNNALTGPIDFAARARARKALALLPLFRAAAQHLGVDAGALARAANESAWLLAASRARVRPPSLQTRALVVELAGGAA